MVRIGFFTAGDTPTAGELTDIANLNSLNEPDYAILVRNGAANPNYGAGPEDFDSVAGTIPDAYSGADTIDPDATFGTVVEGAHLRINNSAGNDSVNGTIVIDGENMSADLAATVALVAHGETVVVKNSAGTKTKNATATVASGAVSGVALAATVALVTHGDTFAGVTGIGTTATISVAAGIVSAIALS